MFQKNCSLHNVLMHFSWGLTILNETLNLRIVVSHTSGHWFVFIYLWLFLILVFHNSVLPLFLSYFLIMFACASVQKSTQALVSHFLFPYWMWTDFFLLIICSNMYNLELVVFVTIESAKFKFKKFLLRFIHNCSWWHYGVWPMGNLSYSIPTTDWRMLIRNKTNVDFWRCAFSSANFSCNSWLFFLQWLFVKSKCVKDLKTPIGK